MKQFEIDDEKLSLASSEAKLLKHNANREIDLFLVKAQSVLEFSKSMPILGSLVADDISESFAQALDSMIPHYMSSTMKNINKASFKLLSNGNVCVAYREQNEKLVTVVVYDKCLNKLHQKCLQSRIIFRGFELVELNEAVILCFFEPKQDDQLTYRSLIVELDHNLRFKRDIVFEFDIIHANAHQDKLYLLATPSRDSKSKFVNVYDENLKLSKNIKLGNSEGLPFYVPDSVTRMRVAENYFVFLDGKNVLLMDRLDGEIKRTFRINSGDFVLDSSANRVISYDGTTEKLVCFDFEGESFEISIPKLKKLEMVDFGHRRFVFFDLNLFGLFF